MQRKAPNLGSSEPSLLSVCSLVQVGVTAWSAVHHGAAWHSVMHRIAHRRGPVSRRGDGRRSNWRFSVVRGLAGQAGFGRCVRLGAFRSLATANRAN